MAESVPTFNIVLIGDSEVGKTSIIHRFIQGSFEKDQKSTIGALFHTFKTSINGRTVMMQIWDTAGQEKYRSLGPIYYRKANAAVAVFDVTNQESFDGVPQWLTEVKKNTINAIFYLAGNKCDLINEVVVQKKTAEDFANENRAKLFLTSAKTGENVKEMFESLFSDITQNVFQATITPNLVRKDVDNTTEKPCC